MKKVKIKNVDNFKNKEDEYENLEIYKNLDDIEIVISKYKRIIKILGAIIISLFIVIILLIFTNENKIIILDNNSRKNYQNTKIKDNTKIENNENNENKQNFTLDENNKPVNDTNEIKENTVKNDNSIIISYDNIYFNFSALNYSTPAVKRKIYVQYMDFWPAFELERFDVHKILLERYEVIVTDKPDYVIFGEFGGQNYDIENRINCIKLFLSIENREPYFDNTDYAIGIHYIQKGDRYFRKPTETHQLTAIGSVYNVTQVKGIDIKKKKFCAWVVSNGSGNVRNSFYDRLSEYKTVDSGGSFRNNVGGPVSDKLKFLADYKFSICFENSKTAGYISEKLSDAFEAGTIPIYYGDDTVLELLNNRSYIHVKDKNDFDEKIELIKKIDQNDTLYEEIIREKIVIDDTRYPREVQQYKNFIYHIIEQDKEKAKRFERRKRNNI